MAKINGIELKGLKGFMGHEGYCYQGNVYKDGKKLGFWSQDSWGGPDDFDFDESILDEACKNYKDGFPDEYRYKEFSDSKEVFMAAVLDMKLKESDCKKEFKRGVKQVYYMTDGFHCIWMGVPPEITSGDDVRRLYPKQFKQMESHMFKNGFKEAIFYPDSFDIIVDKNHSAPDFLITD